MTWLTYLVGTIVGGHSWSSAHMGEGEETIDASLSRRALQLAQIVDYRLSSTNGVGRASARLEIALLYYFQNFRRVYMFMWDQVCRERECCSACFSGGGGVSHILLCFSGIRLDKLGFCFGFHCWHDVK